MKKTMTGMFALAAMILGMSASKGNATPVKAIDSIAVISADSLASADSLKTFSVDSLAGKAFISADSLAGLDTAAMRTHISVRLDSLKGTDSLRAAEAGSITGKITPADGATEVEAVNAEGKLKAAVSQGTFTIPGAKAGNYVITVVGKQPYKSAIVKDVKVEDGKVTDIGEIKLEQ
ncbi:carboxypeptidase-like regulatory domain-containing protein [Chitinophaga sp. Hz27]|uniref:carboxypeptidase-like regulatory domain-containing protein n=1 Tax=Chitinophaga sp. Hz27 TaxID=3347169 RepID=UPI0035DF6C4C